MTTKRIFAPGCALMIHNPELAGKLQAVLNKNLAVSEVLTTCCQHDPQFTTQTEVINICPGCDRRFGKDYQNTSTVSLWEVLAESDFFTFPDYKGKRMSILDACPTREKQNVHKAIRTIIAKMNIVLVEPENTGTKGTCCGDSFYGLIPVEKVKEQMIKRTAEMPSEDVIVYCVSCIKSIHIGGKKPHYLVELLFGEETVPHTFEPEAWHGELEDYIVSH